MFSLREPSASSLAYTQRHSVVNSCSWNRESLLTLALAQGVLSQAVTACPEGKGREGGCGEKARSEGPASTIIPVSKLLVSGVSPAMCSFVFLEAQ